MRAKRALANSDSTPFRHLLRNFAVGSSSDIEHDDADLVYDVLGATIQRDATERPLRSSRASQ